jgi:hypothetical protein
VCRTKESNTLGERIKDRGEEEEEEEEGKEVPKEQKEKTT